ncbi:MAG: hypothetical protein DMG04_10025 [Acidobacteria bacterium]|nr:MAG: hypothetical protein DMG04_10025 [Acidobacteriota bacterium]
MAQEPARSPGRGTMYVVGITCAGVAVLAYSIRDLVVHPVGIEWLILVLLTAASGWATLRIPEMPISFSISDTFIFSTGLLFGPSAGAATAALDALVLSYRMVFSRKTAHRVLFNVSTAAIAMWSATQVFFALAGSRPLLEGSFAAPRLLGLLALFGAIDFGLNTGIVATAVGFERKKPVISVWREHFLGLWVSYFGGVFGAMLFLVLTLLNRFDVLLLIAPLPLILYMTCRHALGRAQDQINHLGKVNRVYVAAIEALAQAVDAKDQVTHDHVRRVQDEAVRLAQALQVDDDGEIQAIKAAALLHDVGKLAIPEHILNKPGRLTPAEYEIMKRHAAIGADILSVIGFPYAVTPIVRHHHENWDGKGYPDGLAGDTIPIGARILAVVDCFDALTSDRPYRPRLSDADALQIVADRRGTMYDPRVVDMFFSLHGAGVAAPSPKPVKRTASTATAPAGAGHDAGEPWGDAQHLRAFFDLGRAAAATPPPALGELLWAHLSKQLPASAFVLYAYNVADDALVAIYASDPAATGDPMEPIPLGERLSGWVAATGQTILNSDARLDLDAAVREQSSLRSALAVRVDAHGRTSGVLSFYAAAPNAFDERHKRLVEAAARVMADTGLVPTASRNDARMSQNRASSITSMSATVR